MRRRGKPYYAARRAALQRARQPYNQGPGGNYTEPNYGPSGPALLSRRVLGQHLLLERDLDAGHRFFGTVTKGLAEVVEYAFQQQGRPNGYILGQDAGGAFVAGLRYGEGTLYTKDAGSHRVYWQGPSIGYDVGGDGSKVMVLVYNLRDPADIYQRFGGRRRLGLHGRRRRPDVPEEWRHRHGPDSHRRWPAAGRQCRLLEVYPCADLESVLGRRFAQGQHVA